MNKETRKRLLQEYKERKAPMGIRFFRCKENGALFLDPGTDLSADLNRDTLQLDVGSHPNKTLQLLWNEHGSAAFEWGVLESLPYEEDHPEKTDYTRDLKALSAQCSARFPQAEPIRPHTKWK